MNFRPFQGRSMLIPKETMDVAAAEHSAKQKDRANRLERRSVLRGLAGAAGAACLGVSGRHALAIDPFSREQPGPMKLSLSAYSFRKELQGSRQFVPSMDLFSLVDYCRDHGVPGVELTSYYFPTDRDADYFRRLSRHCHVQGVSISGGAIRNDFCVADPEKLKEEVGKVQQWVDQYDELGAGVIRIFGGSPAEGVSREQAIESCISGCEQACQMAGEKGILLALENHGGITNTADSMLKIVRNVDSPWFGVNFDSGNFRSTDDPYEELERIAPYAINVQIKTEIWQNGSKVPADLGRIVEILRDANYGGWVALEYEGSEDAREAVPQHLETLKRLLG